ncbi:hypothetical protein COV82_06025 [Candidatus Peregrinibacteria bacterium CG11_big_fil_rev_8_21_14_0_20_46_8]|nr:MAG: hypothetical protein COV82_06025 [Candidatus Peregrinibacteria bacterium CG11_big_fil_rev_8_21_14_0_20_46_8]
MFTKLSHLLPRTINRNGLRGTVNAAMVCVQYEKIAPEIIHPEALKYTHARVYKGGTLIIGVANPAWAQRIKERSAELIEILNKRLDGPTIKEIKTRVTVNLHQEMRE